MAKIDPAFQAAPVLQDTFNPMAFVEQQKQNQFDIQKALYEQGRQETIKGLEDLTTKLKGWEDKSGFDELLNRNNTVKDVYMKVRKMGLELNNPKTSDEVKTYKAINDYHQQTAQLADTWNQQKGIYDKIQAELLNDPDDIKYDHDATQKNLEEVLKTKSIGERTGLLEKAVVARPQIADYAKIITENKYRITQPPRTQVETINPQTGDKEYTLQTGKITPDIIEANKKEFRNIYRTMNPQQKEGIKALRKNDPDDLPDDDGIKMSDDEYFYSLYNPKYKQEFIQKAAPREGSGNSGINISIGGTQAKVTPGVHNKNDNNLGVKIFNDRYDFTVNKPFQVNGLGGEKYTSLPDEKTGEAKWEPITTGTLTKALLQFYDAKSKRLIFKAAAADNLPWMDKDTLFSVPIENVPEAMELPITKDDGKPGKLKDIVGEQGSGARQVVSDDFWNKKK